MRISSQVANGIVRWPSLKFGADNLVRISLLVANGILPIPSIHGGYKRACCARIQQFSEVEVSVRLQKSVFSFVLVDTPCQFGVMAKRSNSASGGETTPKKQCNDCCFDVSDIHEEYRNATVHGVVLQLSPTKVSKKNLRTKFFDGKISDGKRTTRVISFTPHLRTQLEKFRQSSSEVAIVNCSVQKEFEPARRATDGNPRYEVVLSSRTKLQESPRKFRMPENLQEIDPYAAYTLRDLEELEDMADRQSVNALGKVVDVGDPGEVTAASSSQPLQKQDVIIADSKAAVRVVLGEEYWTARDGENVQFKERCGEIIQRQ